MIRARIIAARLGVALGLALISVAAMATPSVLPEPVAHWVKDARLSGQGLFRYWGFAIYDARLWVGPVPPDFDDLANAPLALELRYRRDFSGADIAERSLDEMNMLGFGDVARRQDWLGMMRERFPDVRENDRLLGIIDAEGHTRLFHNDEPAGTIEDRAFSHAFFSIWLSPRTSAQGLRAALLPLPAPAENDRAQ